MVKFKYLKIGILIFIPLAIGLVYIKQYIKDLDNSNLNKYGIRTEGTILEGKAIDKPKGGKYTVTVRFYTKEGKGMVIKQNVNKTEFSNLLNGEIVPVIYSSKNPSTIKIITDEKLIRELTGAEERKINIQDLLNLIENNNSKPDEFLKKICIGWVYNSKDTIWINNRMNEALKIYLPRGIQYITLGISTNYNEQFKKSGFNPLQSHDIKVKLFKNERYSASVANSVEQASVTIVSIVKL